MRITHIASAGMAARHACATEPAKKVGGGGGGGIAPTLAEVGVLRHPLPS